MRLRNTFFTFFSVSYISLSILLLSTSATAQIDKEISVEESFDDWKKEFKKIAMQNGVEKSLLNNILPKLTLLPNVLSADKKQSEFLLTFWDYTDKALSESRIKKGREILKEYQAFLKYVSQKYGVDEHYLVAFWGLETNYGLFKGNIKTLDALATLAYDKRRRSFFTRELITLLKLMQNGEKTPFYGSWAGAFGNFQFMPTTYAAYAIDADGDGNKDIINSMPDAFSSAANYLSKMGWDENFHWGREVKIYQNVNWNKLHAVQKRPVKEWMKLGVKPIAKIPLKEREVLAKLIMPMGVNGPKFLVYPNFDRIMRWNNSTLYALSIGLLSDTFRDDKFKISAKRTQNKISRNDIRFIQKKLALKGYYNAEPDGILGYKTKESIKAYQKAKKIPQDGYPSQKLLATLKKEK